MFNESIEISETITNLEIIFYHILSIGSSTKYLVVIYIDFYLPKHKPKGTSLIMRMKLHIERQIRIVK